MAEQVTAGGPAAVCHHGPIRQNCPVECLQAVLSQSPYRALARAQGAWFPPPRTVGDVIRLYARRDLGDIRGLGPRRRLAGHQADPIFERDRLVVDEQERRVLWRDEMVVKRVAHWDWSRERHLLVTGIG